jgi:DivIVA domain-containing protein
VPADIRDVSFPSAVRGYERGAVDAYVKRVNQLIAELEVSRSPQAAVKHALDRVGQQTSGVLQRAREVAEELTATALADAEQTTSRASDEAEEFLEQARMQAHQLRGQSKEEAEAIIAAAHAQAAQRMKRCEEQLRTLQAAAEDRLREVQAQTKAASDAHRGALEDLRHTVSELEEVARAVADRVDPAHDVEHEHPARGARVGRQPTSTPGPDETVELQTSALTRSRPDPELPRTPPTSRRRGGLNSGESEPEGDKQARQGARTPRSRP